MTRPGRAYRMPSRAKVQSWAKRRVSRNPHGARRRVMPGRADGALTEPGTVLSDMDRWASTDALVRYSARINADNSAQHQRGALGHVETNGSF
jgi:hypothetical protein